jgi:putative component of membrane protein insertase Oxa1/YidC/SpoIIIJ protein YidD
LPGTLFFFCLAAFSSARDASTVLAGQLFVEGRWEECRTEAARRLVLDPGDMHAAYLKAAAETRCGLDAVPALRLVCADQRALPITRQMAACELGRSLWRAGEHREAVTIFRGVFDSAARQDLFLQAACSISMILRDNPELSGEFSGLRLQVRTCYPMFTPELRESCNPFPPKPGLTTRPVEWLIHLYQAQISPAIGARCSLYPSCSRYSVEAMRRHGLLGLAMYADRGFREPDIVAGRAKVIEIGGIRKVADSLDEHDWWMRGAPP